MFKCFNGNHYIWDKHRCNGLLECPDGSDEKGCENEKCQDEKGRTFLIKNSDLGWDVSRCLNCHCTRGLLSCKRTMEINFPGYYHGIVSSVEHCTPPSCNVSVFIGHNKDKCEGVEIIQDGGILAKGQTWNYEGCKFYFEGSKYESYSYVTCPPMSRSACYVYNGVVCCSSECPVLEHISKRFRGNLILCASGRQLVSADVQCTFKLSDCLKDVSIQNCTSEVTCQDEESNQYFEGATWSVGDCLQCSCYNGSINCTRELYIYVLNVDEKPVIEHCNQRECHVARYVQKNKGICKACRWNGKLYYNGDHWKENNIDFHCSSESEKVLPGCYVKMYHVICTGAMKGIRNLSLISKEKLFLCDSGDEIISINSRCDIALNCYDTSDEMNCKTHFCPSETELGFLWPRTPIGEEVTKECSLINSMLSGTFTSKCDHEPSLRTLWHHRYRCGCEIKYLMEYFERKIQDVNETNVMDISREFIGSVRRFKNKKVFHDMLNDLFLAVTRILISPMTSNNYNSAVEFCQDVKQLLSKLISKYVSYGVSDLDSEAFCKQSGFILLQVLEQYDLFYRVLAYQQGLSKIHDKTPGEAISHVVQNFDWPIPLSPIRLTEMEIVPVMTKVLVLSHVRRPLGLIQLNTAPLVPSREEKDALVLHVTPTRAINVTINSSSNSNSSRLNKTSELSIEQIKEILAANNCPLVTYDEETDSFELNNPAVTKESLQNYKIQENMELVLLCVSIAAAIISLILLTIIRVQESERLFVHKNLLLSIGLGNLVYVLDKTLFSSRNEHHAICSAVTIIQQYFHTALFTWMLVEGILLYIKLVKVFTVNKQYLTYVAIGWGLPAIIIGLVAAIDPSTYDMGKTLYGDVMCGTLKFTGEIERKRCWINGSLWIYKGPVLAILVVNLVVFVMLLRVVFGKIATKYGQNKIIAARKGARSIVALLPLLGVTYLLGFFVEFHDAVIYAFIVVNSTQGVIFCIFHCILDDQVREAVKKLLHKKERVPTFQECQQHKKTKVRNHGNAKDTGDPKASRVVMASNERVQEV